MSHSLRYRLAAALRGYCGRHPTRAAVVFALASLAACVVFGRFAVVQVLSAAEQEWAVPAFSLACGFATNVMAWRLVGKFRGMRVDRVKDEVLTANPRVRPLAALVASCLRVV